MMKVFEVADRKGGKWKQSDQDQLDRHEQGNARETTCSATRWVALEFKLMDVFPTVSITLQLLDWNG